MHTIRPIRVNHINAVVEDFGAALQHLQRAYGAELLMDLPQPQWHAGLVDIGRVIIEPFAPPAYLLNARYGPHYLGIEYQADMDVVRAAIAERGIRIVRDLGVALHTHPADCFGVAIEFYGGSFHDNDWPLLGGGKMKPAQYWRDDHPLGLTGLKHYSIAVHDAAAAGTFLQGFLGAKPLYEAVRPGADAVATGFQVADSQVEVLTPSGEGVIRRHLARHGDGIRAAVFGVRDLDQARRYFAERDIPVQPGCAPGSIAVPPEHNLGLIFEFTAD